LHVVNADVGSLARLAVAVTHMSYAHT